MKRLRDVYGYVRGRYALLSLKKYTTLSGTLVFFLIMSIMPFSFWLSIIIAKLPVDLEELFALPVFASVQNVLSYVQREAKGATAGASVVLLATTLYSSTTLFYQMRKSGEIVYNYERETQGLRIRFGAFLLLVVILALAVLFLLIFALGGVLLSRLVPHSVELILDYLLLTAVAFVLALLLNIYVCPYKTPVKRFLPGTVLTVLCWVAAVIGFSVYLQIGNVTKLYGALNTVIVFLLWLYVLMICFMIGVIFNSEKIILERECAKTHKKRGKGRNCKR